MKRNRYLILVLLNFIISCNNTNKGSRYASALKDTTINDVQLVHVARGPYLKGINAERKTLSYDFWIGKYEITNQQFYGFIIKALEEKVVFIKSGELYCRYGGDSIVAPNVYKVKMFDNRIFLQNDSVKLNEKYANHPVVSVTWYGAKVFCDFYGFDLPTEPEWEKAAGGMTSYWYPWGNTIDSSYANYWNSNDPFEPGTTPVGFFDGGVHLGFKTNNAKSPYGCYDMAGNAWEWVADSWSKRIPFHKGKGGGYSYHTKSMLQIYYISSFGPPQMPNIDMCDNPDGFRVIVKK